MLDTNSINIIHNVDIKSGLMLLPDESIDCVITSPPYYGLRDYGNVNQIGLELTPELYIISLVNVFMDIKRVMKKTATLWINIGDSYAGSGCGTNDYRTEKSRSINKSDKMFTKKPPHQKLGKSKNISNAKESIFIDTEYLKPKDLIGIPWMLAFSLRNAGFFLRMDNIWSKPNPMPESVKDRPTKAHEYLFLFSKSKEYYYDYKSIQTNSEYTGVANKKSVWTVPTKPFRDAHFAVFPENLIMDCIKAGCPENGVVLDPFLGSGTTAIVSKRLNRNFIGYDINSDYCKIAERRIHDEIEKTSLFN